MRCPKCDREDLRLPSPCPNCGFAGDAAQVEELAHIAFLLGELPGWTDLSPQAAERLRARYLRRRNELETALDLRPPPEPIEEPRPVPPPTPACPHCGQPVLPDHHFCRQCGKPLLAEVKAPPVKAKVKRVPRPEEGPPTRVEAPVPPPRPPRKPREALTWERIWQTVLSERTLRAMLFLGAFLLFAAGLVLIVFNWDRFPPLVQLLIIAAFTFSFYAFGWYVRTRMRLRNSGIAITATGSLLVPLDFYAIYLSGGFAAYVSAEWIWWIASAVCLAIYSFTVWSVGAEFFGYLVAAAAGSLLCATLWIAGVSADWYAAALCALTLLTTLLAAGLGEVPSPHRGGYSPAQPGIGRGRWRVLHRPLWHAALLAVTTILPLTLGWYAFGLAGSDAFRLSMALSWGLGSLAYAHGAWRFRSRTLGLAAAVGLPMAVYLTQSPLFDGFQVRPAWHALGWALSTPLYLAVGRWLRARPGEDLWPRAAGRIALGVGVALALVAAVWSFTSPTTALDAATATHAVLTLTAALAAWLWRQPRWLLAASLFALVSAMAGMWARELTLAQLGLGWALLAVLHLGLAARLRKHPGYATPVYAAGFAVAALSLLPPLVSLDRGLLIYVLGNWIGLAAWTAWLAHAGQHPGLNALWRPLGRMGASLPHWATAVPIPVWLWLVWTHDWPFGRLDPAWLGVALAVLAWGLVFLGRKLQMRNEKLEPGSLTSNLSFLISLPWYVTGYITSAAAPIAGLLTYAGDRRVLALVFVLTSGLYFVSAWRFKQRWWLVPAGVTLPVAWLLVLAHYDVPDAPTGTLLALVPAAFLLGGALLVSARRVEARFMQPLNVVAHGLAALAVLWGLWPLLWDRLLYGYEWSDPDRLWAAGGQLVLVVAYTVAAWSFRLERWGHVAAWLAASAGGIVATVYSEGRGSSAAKAALAACAYVLAERALWALRDRWSRLLAAWQLYRRPLLIAGWSVSAGAVALALVRNLALLGGGWTQRTWAVVALLIVVGLYALSARLFRRAAFAWLAAILVVIPWTILTHLGWFVLPEDPRLPAYALAWLILAWLLLGLGLLLEWRGARPYGFAPRVVAHVLVPLSLLWCVADVETAYIVWGLGVGFYVVSAAVDHVRLPGQAMASRFIYPAALLAPAWAVYLLAQFVPTAEHLHYGLLLLAFGPIGLLVGILLRRTPNGSPADAVPAYLAAYGSALVGALLVAHDRPWLIAALLLDAALCAFSAWYHKEPLWGYPAAAFPIAALLLALNHYGVDSNRHGWALIVLGAAYLAAAHALRQWGQMRYTQCPAGAVPLMAVAYVTVALGLPPSSRDHDGAFVGYGGAALVYGLSAIWLRQPLFLTPALALAAAPYGVTLHRSPVPVSDYGLWLWPGIALALVVAHSLDAGLGAPHDFPWGRPDRWLPIVAERWLDTWPALPFYLAGYLGAAASVGLSWLWGGDMLHVAAALALAAVVCALAAYRFRLRIWLLATGATAQLAALAFIDHTVGLFWYPARSALAFLPVTAATALLGLLIERRRGEGSPFAGWLTPVVGWSRPLYLLLVIDLLVAQAAAFYDSGPGSLVSLGHALLAAVLASAWALSGGMVVATGLGTVALLQGLDWYGVQDIHRPVALALLAAGYGLVGYLVQTWLGGLVAMRREGLVVPRWLQVWDRPLAWTGLGLTTLALLWMAILSAWDVLWLTVLTLLEEPVREAASRLPAAQMAVVVLAIAGLTYLAAALVERRRWIGYGAVTMLLAAYGLELLLFFGQREVQWYAVPAGVYLLGVGYLEWRMGDRQLARVIDWTALALLFGSAFWQSLAHAGPPGWGYALLMGAEGLAIVLWGSARRQRRFLYAGVAGVVLAVVGQLSSQMVRSFSSLGTVLVLGAVGLVILLFALFVEWRLEAVKQLSRELAKRLEDWE